MTTTRNRQHDGKCQVEGCKGAYEAKGFCNKHYIRFRKFGDPMATKLILGDPDARFAALHAQDEAGCWPWIGWVDLNGYSKFSIGKKGYLAHRWSYERHVGVIPEGLVIDHLCRNRTCVNPEHLEAVTHAENNLRAPLIQSTVNAAKTHCKRGHEFDAKNTYVHPTSGHRQCRRCKSIRESERQRRMRSITQ